MQRFVRFKHLRFEALVTSTILRSQPKAYPVTQELSCRAATGSHFTLLIYVTRGFAFQCRYTQLWWYLENHW